MPTSTRESVLRTGSRASSLLLAPRLRCAGAETSRQRISDAAHAERLATLGSALPLTSI
jgi:hypothetical protein